MDGGGLFWRYFSRNAAVKESVKLFLCNFYFQEESKTFMNKLDRFWINIILPNQYEINI